MTLLIIGLFLWWEAHFLKRLMPRFRDAMTGKFGSGGAKGIMALMIVTSVVFMVIGYRFAPVDIIFTPPSWAKHANNLMMLASIALLGMGSAKGPAGAWLRHPMLWGTVVWAVAHILVNGDLASLVLFGGIGVWALISMILINVGDGPWQRPVTGPASADIKWLLISAVVFTVISGLHIWIGPSPFGA